MASTPSPGGSETLPLSPASSCAQSAKDKRYDRQLRLWGDHGQLALERSKICMINATATATEILKSLVLPGVGQFTIVDGENVTGEDVGNNFFLERENIGCNRGQAAMRLLLELNPEVRGDCVDERADQILNHRPDFFKSFSIVVGSNLDEKTTLKLSKLLWEWNIPFIIVKSYGLIGYIRLQVKEHTVVESHPDNQLEDLRLDRPFQALADFMEAQDLTQMTTENHKHTPYLVILYKCLQEWRMQHQSEMPKTYKEKQLFKELIRQGIRLKEDNVPEDEENFEEALKAANTALVQTTIPNEITDIFRDPKCLDLTSKSDDFWILARGVKDFVDDQGPSGLLPLRGSIPDMFSDSKRHVQLQNIYREKALEDAREVQKKIRYHLERLGRPTESITEDVIRKFCRESSHLRLVRQSGSIADEYEGHLPQQQTIFTQAMEQDPDNDIAYYLILRGVDRFFTEFSALPGALADQVEPDISHLKNCVSKVLSEYHLSSNCSVKDECVYETCRYGGSEPHATAALIGGCAAQEVIKMLTHQYVPINNLFLFNTMSMSSVTINIE